MRRYWGFYSTTNFSSEKEALVIVSSMFSSMVLTVMVLQAYMCIYVLQASLHARPTFPRLLGIIAPLPLLLPFQASIEMSPNRYLLIFFKKKIFSNSFLDKFLLCSHDWPQTTPPMAELFPALKWKMKSKVLLHPTTTYSCSSQVYTREVDHCIQPPRIVVLTGLFIPVKSKAFTE